MKRAAALLAALLAATPATAGQFLVPGHGGLRYAPAAPRYYPPYLQGYVRPWRPNPAPFIAGAILGVATQALPRMAPPPAAGWLPPRRPAAGPGPDAIAEIQNPITRGEVVDALNDWCATHEEAPLCVKLRVR